MDWTRIIGDLIDLRSFSNLWYWIALAVAWSQASHWVIGVPYDMVLRARRQGGESERDLEAIVRINVARLTYIWHDAGMILLAMGSCVLTILALLGFVYKVEFCQAVFLLAFPMAFVAAMSFSTARRIALREESGESLHKRLALHRVLVQVIGMISIFVTAFWGMLQNYNVSILSF